MHLQFRFGAVDPHLVIDIGVDGKSANRHFENLCLLVTKGLREIGGCIPVIKAGEDGGALNSKSDSQECPLCIHVERTLVGPATFVRGSDRY